MLSLLQKYYFFYKQIKKFIAFQVNVSIFDDFLCAQLQNQTWKLIWALFQNMLTIYKFPQQSWEESKNPDISGWILWYGNSSCRSRALEWCPHTRNKMIGDSTARVPVILLVTLTKIVVFGNTSHETCVQLWMFISKKLLIYFLNFFRGVKSTGNGQDTPEG